MVVKNWKSGGRVVRIPAVGEDGWMQELTTTAKGMGLGRRDDRLELEAKIRTPPRELVVSVSKLDASEEFINVVDLC